MALSDRIAVMYHGKIVATLPAASATREELGLLMAGAQPTNVPHEAVTDGHATVNAQR